MPVVLLLAHRGLRGPGRPENSAAAVRAALDAGADGCEVDLRLTADGVLVGAHDDDLARLGLPGVLVSRSRADSLPLDRLDALLAAAGDSRLVLEVKEPPGPLARTALALTGALRSQRHRGRGLDVVVSSFCPELLTAVQSPVLRTALLGTAEQPARALFRHARAGGHAEAHPHVSTLAQDPRAVVAAGLPVVPWTVNSTLDALLLATAGCAAVISDHPDRLRVSLRTVAGVLETA